MIVDCVYRVHTRGEVIEGHFDTEQGIIIECPELFCVDMEKYIYLPRAYQGIRDSISYLHSVLQGNQNLIAAVGQNCEGCIAISHTRAWAMYCRKGYFPEVTGILQRPYALKTECIGVARTFVKQYEVPTRMALVVIDKTDPNPVIHTQQGKKRVAFQYEPLPAGKQISVKRVRELCERTGAYGTCIHNGEVCLLMQGTHSIDLYREGV